VTDRPAFVASPVELPASPLEEAGIFDDFGRLVAAIARSGMKVRTFNGRPAFRAKGAGKTFFYMTPLLADGSFLGLVLAAQRLKQGLSKLQVAAFFDQKPGLVEQTRAWGMHWEILSVDEKSHTVKARLTGPTPVIDPLREAAQADDSETLPLSPVLSEPWATIFTPWEEVDAVLAIAGPGELWLASRRRSIVCPSGDAWRKLEGLRDFEDANSYSDMWNDPQAINVYLGWPAYMVDAAGLVRKLCPKCGRNVVGRATFCLNNDCQRKRAAERQRTSRRARELAGL
jgi:hypothetical protein